jgi:hypothetical protein
MSSDKLPTADLEEPKLGYVNRRGTIYKVQVAEPLPVKTPAEQRRDSFRQHGFMALLSGAARRRHVERLEADRQKALTTIREARKVSGEVIADVGNGTVVKLTEAQATALEQHLEDAGQKLRRLIPDQGQKETNDLNSQPS